MVQASFYSVVSVFLSGQSLNPSPLSEKEPAQKYEVDLSTFPKGHLGFFRGIQCRWGLWVEDEGKVLC